MKTKKDKICRYCSKNFQQKPGTRGLYCSLSCSQRQRNIDNAENRRLLYYQNPKKCLHCDKIIPYGVGNKFCGHSCSAIFTNKLKGPRSNETKLKISIANKGRKAKSVRRLGRRHPDIIKICPECNGLFTIHWNAIKKYCCKICRDKNVGGSTIQNILYSDSFGNGVKFDSSWELKIAKELDKNNIKWIRPKRFHLSTGQNYTPDFFLLDYKVYLDPKAEFRKERFLYAMEKIKLFEKEYNTTCFVIKNCKDLTWEFIEKLLLDNQNKILYK